ncbi:perlucin-like [Pollicipes pollicipes]|uniref:perlucin-like n=1 Tax=Pollicipes pollicipes TaxID=41117 RepID=UPI001884BDBE|nr:perlucin-like [Pollicipes pollicipes]
MGTIIMTTDANGSSSDRCSCPAGFTRCAGRCLIRLDAALTNTEAQSRCQQRGAHLAVPRTEAENQCVIEVASRRLVWLGVTDLGSEGSSSDRCSCPAGFTRCAGRCLVRLDAALTNTEAQSRCQQRGAHLAVPRTEAENQCVIEVASRRLVWLGVTDLGSEDVFWGVDGCGTVPWWGFTFPDNFWGVEHCVAHMLSNWNDVDCRRLYHPLCQLDYCKETMCQ